MPISTPICCCCCLSSIKIAFNASLFVLAHLAWIGNAIWMPVIIDHLWPISRDAQLCKVDDDTFSPRFIFWIVNVAIIYVFAITGSINLARWCRRPCSDECCCLFWNCYDLDEQTEYDNSDEKCGKMPLRWNIFISPYYLMFTWTLNYLLIIGLGATRFCQTQIYWISWLAIGTCLPVVLVLFVCIRSIFRYRLLSKNAVTKCNEPIIV